MRAQLRIERVPIGQSHAPRQALALERLDGQSMQLLIGPHLQPILEPAQEHVGRIELGHRACGQQLRAGEQRQRVTQ